MNKFAALVTGRRTKWLVPLVWIVLAVIFAPIGAKLADATEDDTASFLPAGSESTEVTKLLDERFEGGQTVGGLIVYRREGGLTAADRAKIAADVRRADDKLPLVGQPAVPFQRGSPPALVS